MKTWLPFLKEGNRMGVITSESPAVIGPRAEKTAGPGSEQLSCCWGHLT